MAKVTVVIPVGPGHETLVKRASASVANQTIEALEITVYDHEGHGPGWARNYGLEQVTTDYVLFLDADDWLEPDALEKMLTLALQYPNRYVYSDWWRDNDIVETPITGFAWCGRTWHPISALVPTNWARQVEGFAEDLDGGEDTDFYLKLNSTYRCGMRLPEPLVHYSPDGQRAKQFHENKDYFQSVMDKFTEKYGGKMACCGKTQVETDIPTGQRQEGDVLAAALWGGNRRERGRATGRRYPRTGNGKLVWVDPRDVTASPTLWQRVPMAETTTDTIPEDVRVDDMRVNQVGQMAQALTGIMRPPVKQYRPQPQTAKATAPDVAAIIRMANEGVS